MFTRTIRSHILGKSNVKWDPKNVGALNNQYDKLAKAYDLNKDGIVNPGEVPEIRRDIAADVKNLNAILSNSHTTPELKAKVQTLIDTLKSARTTITETSTEAMDDYRDEI